MTTFHDAMAEYRKQIDKGIIPVAYRGLMEYMMGLRAHFATRYPGDYESGNIYYGYMDMTYFALNPQFFRDRKLKIAVVFLHRAWRFEVWLAGYNKQVQSQYWRLFKESGWGQYHLVPSTQGADAIVEHVLVDNPDFRDLNVLTEQIERGTLQFVQDIKGLIGPPDPE